MVADANLPDRGITVFPTDGLGQERFLCSADASNQGEHWSGPFPYENGPIRVWARQRAHLQPTFAPDGLRVVFTSDRSGWARIHEGLVDQGA
jgi:oligogalacturonide lyase